MSKTISKRGAPPARDTAGDNPILLELRRTKAELFAACGHDLKRMFADARERQERSGHPIVREPQPAKPALPKGD